MTAVKPVPNSNLPPDNLDDAVQLLGMAARLHSARSDSAAWHMALAECRDWFQCDGVLSELADGDFGPDELEALAGRLTHCSNFGIDACTRGSGDLSKRHHCSALAPHLHEAAIGIRKEMLASVFGHLPATWILTRAGKILEANEAAKAVTEQADRFAVTDGQLSPADAAGARLLKLTLSTISVDVSLCWPDSQGEVMLTLRPLSYRNCVSVSLEAEPLTTTQITSVLRDSFELHPRQGELAAHLVEGLSLSEAARVMGITRNTASDHLNALMHRVGVPDRKSLLVMLRRASRS